MLNETRKDADERMQKSVAALKNELSKIRTGRAHPTLLEHITVDYYGTEVPLNQAANINAEDARTLSVVPFDKSMVQKIEKAIMTSDLGLNPATSGANIRVPLPALNEERRAELAKVVHAEGEQAKIAIRNIRRDANHQLKEYLKEKELSEDDVRRGETQVQELTDKYVGQVDELVSAKEQELMEI
ncbi:MULTISPECIES: ribosome recycling factor [unclassified Wenzhouxiangella]|uniref:ribosome recycling factor n=1 Tax=unclassified Wenzhouxiangella TaxID=2613841 RepID=UPI000E32A2C1|nr:MULTISPECIES: ribosome recycling factor [unclassified Wenzhouxiangella]RFF27094.1 ribosome recycling factor [Wenzhouxiangella sp. 15181]RFP69220.1 ribosome recycling factor [Wenzhouxiangella sp. 15190]